MIKIGTRGSKLALWQANFIQKELKGKGLDSELVIIKTKGDKIQDLSFDKIEGKGFFTKEIEDALLNGNIDIAIHSMKDLPTQPVEGLVIAGVSEREDPADWLIIRPDFFDDTLPFKLKPQTLVGTSSARRKAQMAFFRPDTVLDDVRGNVPTRISKLREGQFGAILLAAAGLKRLDLDLSDLRVVKLNTREFIPAPAQGVLAYQTREDNLETRKILKTIHHPDVAEVTNVERKVLNLMGGGCHMPLGVYCQRDELGNFHTWAAMANDWKSPLRKAHFSSTTHVGLAETIVSKLKE